MSDRTLTDKCDISKENVTLSCFKPGDPNSVLSCIFDCHYAYQEDIRIYCRLIEQRCSMIRDMIEEAASVELRPPNLKSSYVARKFAHSKEYYTGRVLV